MNNLISKCLVFYFITSFLTGCMLNQIIEPDQPNSVSQSTYILDNEQPLDNLDSDLGEEVEAAIIVTPLPDTPTVMAIKETATLVPTINPTVETRKIAAVDEGALYDIELDVALEGEELGMLKEVDIGKPVDKITDLRQALTDEDCRLPCLMSFQPSESSLSVMVDQIRLIADKVGTSIQGDWTTAGASFLDSDLSYTDYPFYQEYYAKDDVLNTLSSDLPNLARFSISSIFEEYGEPSEIYISTEANPFFGVPVFYFKIFLFYPEQGFQLRYDLAPIEHSETIEGCVGDVLSGNILTWDPSKWDPEGRKTIVDRNSGGFAGESWDGKFYEQPLETTTDMTITDLAEVVITGSSTVCIETPNEHWPEYSGGG